jgi:hypothetical protein
MTLAGWGEPQRRGVSSHPDCSQRVGDRCTGGCDGPTFCVLAVRPNCEAHCHVYGHPLGRASAIPARLNGDGKQAPQPAGSPPLRQGR